MTRYASQRRIKAAPSFVFQTFAFPENFQKSIPHIVKMEFLSEQRSGVGTRFRETRLMGKREAMTELECTEFVENSHVRFVSDAGNTIWDTVMTVTPDGKDAKVQMVMDAKPYKFMARVVGPLIKGIVSKALEKDMDCLKTYCEEAQQNP